MILDVGIDIEKIMRFNGVSEEFLNLIFTKKEIKYCRNKKQPLISFAGKFCAKEAVIKAHKKKMDMKDIEISLGEDKKIKVSISGKYQKNIFCSISHTNENAIAYVIIEK